MSTKQDGVSLEVEERNMTVALRSLFASVAGTGAAEDPLALICTCIVGHTDNVVFAFYCYEDDETGQVVIGKNAAGVRLPPSDVQRKVVTYVRRLTQDAQVAEIDPRKSLELLDSADRDQWKPHRGLAVAVTDGKRPVAVLAIYFAPGFAVKDRHRAWMALCGQTASSFVARQAELRQAQDARDRTVRAHIKMSLQVEAVRAAVRDHLSEMEKAGGEYRAGRLTLREVLAAGKASARRLDALVHAVDGDEAEGRRFILHGTGLEAWVEKGLTDSRIKAIVGLRGTGKSVVLHAVRARALAEGVSEDRIVTIDFEDARFRRFKTAEDVLAYLGQFPKSPQTSYLFMSELGIVNWHTQLLARLRNLRGWNVWLTASSVHDIGFPDGKANGSAMTVYRLWPNLDRLRSCDELERIWCRIFMRDMSNGVGHPDLRAKELLAEYWSDHLGELKSLRDISGELDVMGRHLSKSSITSYRRILESAYLVEFSEVYDVSNRTVVRPPTGRVFFTDLELRNWRFGSAPTEDATRLALNRLYLELRRTHDKVYTPRGGEADFVTLEPDGSVRPWTVTPGDFVHPERFRGK